jgi:RNA polymerase subunit RPABC4/transcription elongation factor Spt4
VIENAARGAQFLLAIGIAYIVALWFALVAWTFLDIESRSRSVFTQVFSTLLVVLFFIPGLLLYLILRPKETLDQTFQRALEEEYLLQDLDDLPLCPGCHRSVDPEFVLCPHCQTRLRAPCPSCSRLIDRRWSVCPYCAVPVETGVLDSGEPAPTVRVIEDARGARRRRAVAAAARRVGMEPDELDAITDALADGNERAAMTAGDAASLRSEASQTHRFSAGVRSRFGQLLPGGGAATVERDDGDSGAEPSRGGGEAFWADPIPGTRGAESERSKQTP